MDMEENRKWGREAGGGEGRGGVRAVKRKGERRRGNEEGKIKKI